MSKSEFGGITGTVRDVMKRVLSKGAKLFSGLDQGSGKCNSDTLLLVARSQTREAQIWLNEEHGKLLKIMVRKNMKYLPKIQKDEKQHNKKLDKKLAAEI